VTLRTLDGIGSLAGVRTFVRTDFNVPLDGGRIADDARIRAALPTLRELLEGGASLVVASHLGRPHGRPDPALSLAPVAQRLGELLRRTVELVPYVSGEGVAGPTAHTAIHGPDGAAPEIAMVENLRFDPGEEANDAVFAEHLEALADAYVDDAFGAVHRAHASVAALPARYRADGRPAAAGRLLQREVDVLSKLRDDPEPPYVAVLGGAKVSDKLATLAALIERVDALLVGGAMAFTLIAARGGEVGDSLVERDRIDEVQATLNEADDRGVVVQLPEDVVAAPELSVDAERRTVKAADVPAGLRGFDIGPRTVEEFARTIADARTILWNGPMGVFELEPFSAGTRGVATAIAGTSAFSVAGGGDSLAAIARYDLEGGFDHLSTGGGASLEFLEGRTLPGIAALEDARS
jgi:phosphoglycerate kinase